MRARRRHFLHAVVNLVGAVVLAAVSLRTFVFETRSEPRPAPHPPRPFVLPGGQEPEDEPVEVALRAAPAGTDPEGPTAAEDRRALEDPQGELEASWRVLFVALDPVDRTAHGCILASRALGEQVYLVPGQRLGRDYVLLAIDPVPGQPRGARLRFSDLRRGVPVELALSPAP